MVRAHIKNKIEDMDKNTEMVGNDLINTIRTLTGLYGTIQENSKKIDTDDTLAVMTVLHVPAMYWHDHDGPYFNCFQIMMAPTQPQILNMKLVVDKVNLTIEAFNLEIGSRTVPKLQQLGEVGRQGEKVMV
jgi:hypothetical protein